MKRKEMEIELQQYEIEQRILTYCYYLGEARREAGIPQKMAALIQASKDDKIQISDHISNAVSEMSQMLNRYFSTCKNKIYDDFDHEGYRKYIFNFVPPYNFPLELMTELENTMESYVTMRTINSWILQNKPDEATLTASEVNNISMQLRELMCNRIKPKRNKDRAKNCIEL